ncbi:hypothetical protein BU23DRAFT_574266 [Bimuria novae-zelandiae CBS 107.79]|uniref:Uncharacterized protein n=1 Tax=Bimuria novae-zelandiae CBS 107.79 TaxID=1447943 RepID=A0A6A5UN58_9PLEO|nr:hypothetical protein BU23DRAFT_574266 [Bimuria novae-zelandiae CBS 107.79]
MTESLAFQVSSTVTRSAGAGQLSLPQNHRNHAGARAGSAKGVRFQKTRRSHWRCSRVKLVVWSVDHAWSRCSLEGGTLFGVAEGGVLHWNIGIHFVTANAAADVNSKAVWVVGKAYGLVRHSVLLVVCCMYKGEDGRNDYGRRGGGGIDGDSDDSDDEGSREGSRVTEACEGGEDGRTGSGYDEGSGSGGEIENDSGDKGSGGISLA